MTYKVMTHFDQPAWDRYGLNWVRTAKLNNLKGSVVGLDLSEETQSKIASFGFSYIPYNNKQRLQPPCDDTFLLTKADVLPVANLSEGYDVVCPAADFGIFDLVWSVAKLADRVNIIRLIGDQVYSPNFVLGTESFWRDFSNFQDYVNSRSGFLDGRFLYGNILREELLFNLYLTMFDPKIRVHHD